MCTRLRCSAAEVVGHAECEVEALRPVQPGVAHGFVAQAQVFVAEFMAATEALGHIIAREFDVDTASPRPYSVVGIEEAVDLGQDVVEVPCLAA